MDYLRDRLEDSKRYDPTRQIILIWDIADVLNIRPDLTDEQANGVLQEVKRNHQADIGVSWDTLKVWADELYPIDDIVTLHASKEDDCGLREFEFVVNKTFLEEFLDGEQTVESFLEEYTSEDSLDVYLESVLENRLLKVSGDCWYNDEEVL